MGEGAIFSLCGMPAPCPGAIGTHPGPRRPFFCDCHRVSPVSVFAKTLCRWRFSKPRRLKSLRTRFLFRLMWKLSSGPTPLRASQAHQRVGSSNSALSLHSIDAAASPNTGSAQSKGPCVPPATDPLHDPKAMREKTLSLRTLQNRDRRTGSNRRLCGHSSSGAFTSFIATPSSPFSNAPSLSGYRDNRELTSPSSRFRSSLPHSVWPCT